MKNCLVVLPFLVSIFAGVSQAQAYGTYHSYSSSSYGDGGNGFILQADGIYYFTTEGGNTGNPNTTVTRQYMEALLGYHWGLFFLGANYNYDAIVTSGNGPTSTDSFRAYGGDLGIMTSNLYLFFTYYFSSIGTIHGGVPASQVDFTNGNGYQIKLGYLFDVGSGFSVGPAMSYKSITYNNLATGPSTSFTYTTLVPEANVRYTF